MFELDLAFGLLSFAAFVADRCVLQRLLLCVLKKENEGTWPACSSKSDWSDSHVAFCHVMM